MPVCASSMQRHSRPLAFLSSTVCRMAVALLQGTGSQTQQAGLPHTAVTHLTHVQLCIRLSGASSADRDSTQLGHTHRCNGPGAPPLDSRAAAADMLLSAKARQPAALMRQEPRWEMSSQYSTTASCSSPARHCKQRRSQRDGAPAQACLPPRQRGAAAERPASPHAPLWKIWSPPAPPCHLVCTHPAAAQS